MSNEIRDLQALRNGSHSAFETIYLRYAGKLHNFVMTLSHGDRYMAEEIVQTTFVKLWEVRRRIDPQRPILYYLSSIAKNTLLNSYQRQTVEFLYRDFLANSQTFEDDSTAKIIEKEWLEGYINELVEQLPPSRKKIFILRKREDKSNKEIAEIMHISVSTVETQLSLAVKFLRKQLEKHYDKLFYMALLFVNLI